MFFLFWDLMLSLAGCPTFWDMTSLTEPFDLQLWLISLFLHSCLHNGMWFAIPYIQWLQTAFIFHLCVSLAMTSWDKLCFIWEPVWLFRCSAHNNSNASPVIGISFRFLKRWNPIFLSHVPDQNLSLAISNCKFFFFNKLLTIRSNWFTSSLLRAGFTSFCPSVRPAVELSE